MPTNALLENKKNCSEAIAGSPAGVAGRKVYGRAVGGLVAGKEEGCTAVVCDLLPTNNYDPPEHMRGKMFACSLKGRH